MRGMTENQKYAFLQEQFLQAPAKSPDWAGEYISMAEWAEMGSMYPPEGATSREWLEHIRKGEALDEPVSAERINSPEIVPLVNDLMGVLANQVDGMLEAKKRGVTPPEDIMGFLCK
jgi:hypothetical protein